VTYGEELEDRLLIAMVVLLVLGSVDVVLEQLLRLLLVLFVPVVQQPPLRD